MSILLFSHTHPSPDAIHDLVSTTRIGGSSIFSSSTAQLGGTKTVFVVDTLTERVWCIGRCGYSMRVSTLHNMRVCRVCRWQVYSSVCLGLEPHMYFSFLAFFSFLCFAAAPSVSRCLYCITPCLKFPSSALCGSHGTTAVAQQVCVDHFYARVDIAYAWTCYDT